jgi:hypothetical protein
MVSPRPPQTIISLPVHTDASCARSAGASVKLVAIQQSVPYRPPVFNRPEAFCPPQTIISLPVHTAVCQKRPAGALVVQVTVQLSVMGLYLPPVLKGLLPSHPPQTIISLTVEFHTAV